MNDIDLFGNEYDSVEQPEKTTGKYQIFRRDNNYRKGYNTMYSHLCKNCGNRITIEHHDKYYHKCKLQGISQCESSDIRLSYICDKWIIK
jgi:hypothetical protein